MKGYVGEIFSSIQGEGIYAGRRQVFVRLAGCPLRCRYCDTQKFLQRTPPYCLVEKNPGSSTFEKLKNPVDSKLVVEKILGLRTSDLHSVSLTGGEPLYSKDFLVEIARRCKERGLKIYLETSGVTSSAMKAVLPYLDYAAIDLKLPEHQAVPRGEWAHLLKEELESVRQAVKQNVETFVKIVVLNTTKPATVYDVCKKLRAVAKVPVVIQPVTPVRRGISRPTARSIFEISEKVAELGLEVWVVPQLHRMLGMK